MGVPGFFAWLLKNYKKNEIIQKNLEKKIKILYIDANCLFHPQCFKILESFPDLTDNITKLESYMIRRIINYINFLIKYTNPEIVYIAVDGVAPLAKIAQQRKRRFKSTQDNLLKENIKKKYNIPFNNSWSNIKITPGTEFMEKIHSEIYKYIKKTQKTQFIYSSYHTPGEGEHKILEDIRKRTNLLNNSDIYVIYGLDADLIFLSMAANKEQNIYLLRESSHLDGRDNHGELYDPIDDVIEELKYVSIDQTKMCYNQQIKEIINKKASLNLELNLELNLNFTNDFIFLCYLLGNDFLPHLPSIDIKKGGLDFLIECYTDVYIMTQQNLIYYEKNKIKINYIILTEILKLCSNKESYYFTKILPESLNKLDKKKCPFQDNYKKEIWDLDNLKNINRHAYNNIINLGTGKPHEWKSRYYNYYFNNNNNNIINNICKNYFEGLEWVTKYYFEGPPTWLWQYKYTHAPFISDLYNYIKYNKVNIKFKKEGPLKPCVQLLCVLPPACHQELPKEYQVLVLNKDSPIKSMFPEPEDIKIDYINKELLYQCDLLVPYLDINIITETCSKIELSKTSNILNKICCEYKFS